ncbi:MAG: aliphatic sulfonate ABC transporter substrate-binding protein [Janthinobacterium lividum]
MMRRRTLMGTALAAAAATPARAAGDLVRLGYIADYQNASLPAIAADQKMWQAEGLVPDVKVFTNGPIQIQAMGAGSLDFGAIGPGALWLPASGRTKVVAVNLLTFSDRVISQPGITRIEDLRGKKVGVPQGTSGEMILRLALGRAGMTVADIDVVPMDPSTVVAAFSSGQIAGAGLWYPLLDVIRRRVPGVVELANDEDFYPKTSFINTFVARNDTLRENPQLVTRFVRVLKRAMDYRVANFDRSVELSATFLGVPRDAVMTIAKTVKLLTSQELVHLTEDGTVDGWLSNFNELFHAFGKLPTPLPPSQYYEGKLFSAA